jgi:hypothetical protein
VSTAKTRVPEINRGELYKPYQKPRPEIAKEIETNKAIVKAAGLKFN